MKKEDLFQMMEHIDQKYLEIAETYSGKKKRKIHILWAAAIICISSVIGTTMIGVVRSNNNHVQKWNESFSGKQYFKYSASKDGDVSISQKEIAPPYEESRFYSDDRSILEQNGMIPKLETHPMFTAQANYNEDGSLYNVELLWQIRDIDNSKNYSDLKVIVADSNIQSTKDYINMKSTVTITERDGIQIIAEGGEHQDKIITFKNEFGWYEISGSWNDSYESVVELLDWFWEHPIDITYFSIEDGDKYTYSNLLEMPDALSNYLPEFETYGLEHEESTVILKNGEAVAVDAYYTDGYETIHWCLQTEPNSYELAGCIGNVNELTKEQVIQLKTPDRVTAETKIQFMQENCVVIIYTTDVELAWQLMETLK